MKSVWLILSASLALPAMALAEPPPASAYADLPISSGARLSPDGKSFSVIEGAGETLALIVFAIDSDKHATIRTGEWNPSWVRWKDNGTLLASLTQTMVLQDGVPAPGSRLVALSADGTKVNAVVFDREEDPDSETYGNTENLIPNIQDDIISDLPGNSGHILMEVPYTNYEYPTVFDVNLWNGDKSERVGDFDDVTQWAVDQNGVVRAGITYTEQGDGGRYESHVIARKSASDSWHRIAIDADQVAFSAADPNILYALQVSPRRIVSLDITTGLAGATIAADQLGSMGILAHGGVMVGYTSTDGAGIGTFTYTDPVWASDAAAIAGALKLKSVNIVDRSDDDQRITALVSTSGKPETLWLLDKTNLAPLVKDYPDVPDDQITQGAWSSFKARDGLEIPVLITLPPNPPKGPIPFVVMPHGGPSSRDTGSFNWMVQFLVSRGYGVLQPQFRGSAGFGADFQRKGYRQWGLAMQDDITDATNWLVSQNLTSPGKMCIVGASYGGYAALEAAVKEPKLYNCAAAISAVSDLPEFLRDQRNFAFSDSNIPAIGVDSGQLEATSPDRLADHIQIPILLIHGKKDYTVNVRQTELMEKALQAAGKTEQTIYLPEATHYLERPQERLTVLNALETFLAANLQAK